MPLGGTTLHAYLGCGLAQEPVEQLVERVMRSKATKRRLCETDVLVLEELGMVHADLFDKLGLVLQAVRKSPQPFGGVQLVLAGDFHQLPPVDRIRTRTHSSNVHGQVWCFQGKVWPLLRLTCLELKQVQRQRDIRFIELLRRAATGDLTVDDMALLHARVGVELDTSDGIGVTVLVSYKREADQANAEALERLSGETAHEYEAVVETVPLGNNAWYETPKLEQAATTVHETLRMDRVLRLKVGAQVMLRTNLDMREGLVNGLKGIVEEMHHEAVVVRFLNGVVVSVLPYSFEVDVLGAGHVCFTQLPLSLAWATTTHKSQGMTLQRVRTNLSRAAQFAPGMAFTRLSRVASLEGLQLDAVDASAFYMDAAVREWKGLPPAPMHDIVPVAPDPSPSPSLSANMPMNAEEQVMLMHMDEVESIPPPPPPSSSSAALPHHSDHIEAGKRLAVVVQRLLWVHVPVSLQTQLQADIDILLSQALELELDESDTRTSSTEEQYEAALRVAWTACRLQTHLDVCGLPPHVKDIILEDLVLWHPLLEHLHLHLS
jgi:hypothetical protein